MSRSLLSRSIDAHISHSDGGLGNVHGAVVAPKQGDLRRIGRVLGGRAVAHGQLDQGAVLVVRGKELGAVQPKAVEPAAQGQRLEHPLVAVLQVDATRKVEERRRATPSVPQRWRSPRLPRRRAWRRAQSESPPLVHRELEGRFVDIGTEDGHALTTRLFHQVGDLLDVVHVVGQLRRHEFGRVVGLQVSRLIRHPCVARGVRLVEGVGGKRSVRPNLLQLLRVVSLLGAARHEVGLHLVDDVLLLFPRLPQAVGLALGKACSFWDRASPAPGTP